MTTLYRPVLIESAEQAEALPIGTLAIGARGDGTVAEAHLRKHPEGWVMTGLTGATDPQWLVGWSALVPIEAEEEWTPMVDGYAYVNGEKSEAHVRATVAEWPGAETGHRLVTPWEEA